MKKCKGPVFLIAVYLLLLANTGETQKRQSSVLRMSTFFSNVPHCYSLYFFALQQTNI